MGEPLSWEPLVLRSSIAMASLPISGIFSETTAFCSPSPLFSRPSSSAVGFLRGRVISRSLYSSQFHIKGPRSLSPKKVLVTVPRSSGSSDSNSSEEDTAQPKKSFGYSRKDVLLIGLGVTALGVGMESGLEFVGVDPLQAGNVVQLVLVLGLTVGWISTYIFRVSNKEMTYAQQLRDYENKVMEKRLEGLSEAELQALLQQVEEEKIRVATRDQVN